MNEKLNILLLEDSEDDMFLLARELKKGEINANITRISSAEELQKELATQTWDVIISDHNMPSFDAPTALSIVRSKNFDIPFLVVSGTIGEEVAVQLMRNGAHDFLMKGNLGRLPEVIRREIKEAEIRRQRHWAETALQLSYEKVRKTLFDTINAISTAYEMHDMYTAGHQKRVATLAVAIAKEIGLPKEQIEGLSLSGLVHDIGKINVPAEILVKPHLSDIEFSLIKNHAESGYMILKDIDFPWPLAETVYQHHERLNGIGYPRALSGDAILIEARILAVADVVEAMSSHRPYRPALGITQALNEINLGKGTAYDSDIVTICTDLFLNKGFLFS